MTTLAELCALVREQSQTTPPELPDTTIIPWLQQAFERTIAAENDWPFYQHSWTITQPAGDTNLTLPGDVNVPQILSLVSPQGLRLTQIAIQTGEDVYGYLNSGSTGSPIEYSVWGTQIILWPQLTADSDRTFQMRGYRYPRQWSTMTPGDAPDCDERLHLALSHYATALAYAQQEDEVLESSYMDRWQRDVEMARAAIMEPPHHRPVVMGPHYRTTSQPGRPFVIVPPGGP